MNILVQKHLSEQLLLVRIEPARVNPFFGILVRPKQHVPPGDVAIIFLVPSMLMVNPVHLGSLEEEPYPTRRLYIGVIEELAKRCAQCVDCPGFG